jgi:hypothetical protein
MAELLDRNRSDAKCRSGHRRDETIDIGFTIIDVR